MEPQSVGLLAHPELELIGPCGTAVVGAETATFLGGNVAEVTSRLEDGRRVAVVMAVWVRERVVPPQGPG